MNYTPVIGLEVHLQLKTRTKIFCGCSPVFGADPNSQVCPICLGMPGVLPVLNRQVLYSGIRVALGLGCKISSRILFHRKNYFYPDLPKGYQISQFDLPLGTGGVVEVDRRAIRINRVHMEEDAGKLVHKEGEAASLVDFNRGGVPLLEIVSEADLTSPEETYQYLKTLKGILQYLEVSDCDMEKGSLRCDANISLASVPPTQNKAQRQSPDPKTWGKRVEIKNLNSFKAVSRSIRFEIQRQSELLDSKEPVQQETRLWDDVKGLTQGMRSKEYAHDYRYFPEPDLVPFEVSGAEIEKIRLELPEFPKERAARFVLSYQLPEADALTLTALKPTADYFEKAAALARKQEAQGPGPKVLANWILGDIARELNDRNLDDIAGLKFPPEHLIELVGLIHSGKISGKMAKDVFVKALESRESPASVVRSQGLSQVTDRSALQAAAQTVLSEQPRAVANYKEGKQQALMFLVGQLMRRTKGAASPAMSQEVLRELLEKQ